jgi:DNA-binding SARP family transcriptional activator
MAILTLHAREVVSRDRLIDELWGEKPPPTAVHAIQEAISRLRQRLGVASERLETRSPGYLLRLDDVEIDARRCERLWSEGRATLAAGEPERAERLLGEALGLWRGPPLVDFIYAPFAQVAVAGLEDLRLECREDLIDAELALGRHAEVVPDLESLIAEQPLRERPRGQLMLALYRCGRQADALSAYQQIRAVLQEDLGLEPGHELRELQARILAQEPTLMAPAPDTATPGQDQPTDTLPAGFPPLAVTPRTSEGSFVGRQECLDQLRSRWEQSKSGTTNVVVLVGVAGVGKTRLAARFAEEVHADGGIALYGRADEESLLPYQPVAELLERLLTHAGEHFRAGAQHEVETLSPAFPNLSRFARSSAANVDKDTMRHQVFEAVVSVTARAAAQTPLLLVLDDLQWADRPTLLLLQHLMRRIEGSHVMVLGTCRPPKREDPLDDLLADLLRERRYDELRLEGLDEDATRELVADRLTIETTPGFIDRLRRLTNGNAFFIEETCAFVESALAERSVIDEHVFEALGVPDRVAKVILRRLGELSSLAQEFLSVASVVGPTFSVQFVETVMRPDRSEDQTGVSTDVIAAAEEAIAAGLTIVPPDRSDQLMFSHALVREVLYERLTVSRPVLHHRVALDLEELSKREPVHPAELAHHFRHAGGPASREPERRYAIEAGKRAAEQFAYEEAIQHFRRALELFDEGDDAGRCDVLLRLGRVQWHAGDDAARDSFMEAAARAERLYEAATKARPERPDGRRRAAEQLARAALGVGERYFEVTYDSERGVRYRALMRRALTALGETDSPRRALLLSRLAVNLAFPNEDEEGLTLGVEAVEMARRLGDDKLLVAALLARHITLLDARHIEERLSVSEEFCSLAGGHEELAAEGHHWRMYDLLGVGNRAGAEWEYRKLEILAKKLGQPLLRSLALGARGLWAEMQGRDERAERCADRSLEHAKLAHTKDAVSSWASQLFALRRRQERVGELASVIEPLVRAGGRDLGWLAALGVLRLDTGDRDAARTIYETEMGDGVAGVPRGMFRLTRLALLAELSARLGDDLAGADQLYRELTRHSGCHVAVTYCSFWGPVDGYLARLAEALGNSALAAKHRSKAIQEAEAMGAVVLAEELRRREDTFRALT